MKTYSVKLKDVKDFKWYILDAKDLVLGRIASKVAKLLLGKHKVTYAPYADVGDYVIVINANQIKVTGNKDTDKFYYTHSGKVGNLKKTSFNKLQNESSEKLLKIAVKGMLPKNVRGRNIFKKLKVYQDSIHPHIAQQPIQL